MDQLLLLLLGVIMGFWDKYVLAKVRDDIITIAADDFIMHSCT